MITRGLSCDRVEFGHFGAPLPPPPPATGLCINVYVVKVIVIVLYFTSVVAAVRVINFSS